MTETPAADAASKSRRFLSRPLRLFIDEGVETYTEIKSVAIGY